MQRAGYGTRGQRMMDGVGAEICCAVVMACRIAGAVVNLRGAIAAETAAAGRARERRRSAAASMRDGRPAAEMPAASGKPCAATVEATPATAAEMAPPKWPPPK